MTPSIFVDINVFSLCFDRPVFGWLPWSPGVSKKKFLSGNVLIISWPLVANTKKITFEKKFPTFHRVANNLTYKFLKELNKAEVSDESLDISFEFFRILHYRHDCRLFSVN
jgi:hypothetical protein